MGWTHFEPGGDTALCLAAGPFDEGATDGMLDNADPQATLFWDCGSRALDGTLGIEEVACIEGGLGRG